MSNSGSSHSQIDLTALPEHIAIVMDGNGRWARKQGKPRTYGHKKGLQVAKEISAHAKQLGIKYITLYIFSTENWKRAEEEVSFLMGLIKEHLRKEYDFYRENGIRVIHTGDYDGLPRDIQNEVSSVIEDTKDHEGLIVNMAINYGGRDEIVRSVQRCLEKGIEPTEESITANLDNPGVPDCDLIIRTGGEERISNFMLWRASYSEFYFCDTLWPEWTPDEFDTAVLEFQRRNRRFGGTKG